MRSATSRRRERSSKRCASRSARRERHAAERAGARPPSRRRTQRAARAERAIRELDQPLPFTGPLAAGDPVEAPGLGVHGTIARDRGRRRRGGRRLRPAHQDPARPPPSVPAAGAGAGGPGQGRRDGERRRLRRARRARQRAQEAREAVRSFVDDAALAGCRASASSTAAARARCGPPCGTSWTGTRSSTGARATLPTAPRSRTDAHRASPERFRPQSLAASSGSSTTFAA